MRKKISFTAILLFFCTLIFAQEFIKGKVFNEIGEPLIGASVLVGDIGQSTNTNGEFNFPNVKEKSVTLTISYIGYEKYQQKVTVPFNQKIILKKSIGLLQEITVTSLRANDKSPVAYTNISKESIEKNNLGQDIPYLLNTTPSFVATSDAGTGIGYTGFRIRGTDANRTNITVNGIPLNDAESHGTFFVNMPDFASSLSSVQVQRGVGTSTNGAAAFGASINMQTELLNSKAYAEIGSSYGSFNTNKNTLKVGTGLINNHFAFDARLSNVTSDGYIDRAWVNMQSYYFSASYYNEKTTIRFLTFGGKEKTYQAWNGVDAQIMQTDRTYNELGEYTDNEGKTQYYNNQTDNYNQTHYQLHFSHEFTPSLQLNAAAHYTHGIGYYEEYKTGRSYADYGLTPDTIAGIALTETDLVRQKWLDNDFYGVTYSLNYETKKIIATLGGAANQYAGNHFGKVIWVRDGNNVDMSKDWYRSTSLKNDVNIYAKINAEVLKNLFGSADLQYRYISYSMNGTDDKYDETTGSMRNITTQTPYIYNFFNPKFGLTYKIDDKNDVYISYSISNREPNRNNYLERSATETQPTNETLYDKELGYRYQSANFSAGLNLYYMHYLNQLILTGKISEIGELLTTNIPNSYRTGIELTAGAKFTDWIKWDFNLAISQNKILNFTEEGVDEYDANWNWIGSKNNYLETTDIAYSPNVVMNNVFTFTFNKFEIGIYSNYVSRQYFDNTSSIERSIDPYFVNNLSIKYSLPVHNLRGIDFKLMINNILNEQYESNAYTWYSYYLNGNRVNESRYFPQAGINLLGGITVKF